MTRDEEILIREAALFCWVKKVEGLLADRWRCTWCPVGANSYLGEHLAESGMVKHTESHLGERLTPKVAAAIAPLRALGCTPEDIVQQVTGHPPFIAAQPEAPVMLWNGKNQEEEP